MSFFLDAGGKIYACSLKLRISPGTISPALQAYCMQFFNFLSTWIQRKQGIAIISNKFRTEHTFSSVNFIDLGVGVGWGGWVVGLKVTLSNSFQAQYSNPKMCNALYLISD